MFIITPQSQREYYEQNLYGVPAHDDVPAFPKYTRIGGFKLILYDRDEIAVPKTIYLDSIIGAVSYEDSACSGSTFAPGAANIATATIELAYKDSEDTVAIDQAKENYTLFNLYGGYSAVPFERANSTPSDSTAYVPLGVFVLQDKACKLGENKYVIKLQSLMTKFDKNLPAVFDVSVLLAQQLETAGLEAPNCLMLLQWICNSVEKIEWYDSNNVYHSQVIQLSSQMSDASYLAQIPNIDNVYFNITQDSGYLTYRDIIKDIAAICGCFATMDPAGNLLLVPFAPAQQQYGINDDSVIGSQVIDLVTKYEENIGDFRIDEIRCRAVIGNPENADEKIEGNYDYPQDAQDYIHFYDITGIKLLSCIIDTDLIQNISSSLYSKLAYTINGTPRYQPKPFKVTAATPEFRFQLGDWLNVRSQCTDRNGNNLTANGQLMKISWKFPGQVTYSSYTTPSANDRNASKRQSGAQGDFPTDEGGEPPIPPDPPIVIIDDYGQWKFGDDAAIIEEIQAVGEPGRTYHVSQYGQWQFGSTNI